MMISREGRRCDDTGGVDTNTGGISGNPFGGGIGVFHAGGKLVFRRKSIIHRNDTATTRVGDHPAHAVWCIEVAENPGPAWKYTIQSSGSAPADAGVYIRKGNAPSGPGREPF